MITNYSIFIKEGFLNKHKTNNIENYLDNILLKKYNQNNFIKFNSEFSPEISYDDNNNFLISIDLKDESVYIFFMLGTIQIRKFVKNKYFINWFEYMLNTFYDDQLFYHYKMFCEDLKFIKIFDKYKFSYFIDRLISSDIKIVKYIDNRIKNNLNKEIYDKYSSYFTANNFDLI